MECLVWSFVVVVMDVFVVCWVSPCFSFVASVESFYFTRNNLWLFQCAKTAPLS